MYKTPDKTCSAKSKHAKRLRRSRKNIPRFVKATSKKENKLTIAIQKFYLIKMKPDETMVEFYERFSSIVIKLTTLGKEYTYMEVALQIVLVGDSKLELFSATLRSAKGK
ncbi:hypothetical protein F511_06539 [Dorcoceras hygrometricum]|uniref:Uncharacterized protein n=1 Tax=Dorcoceras hygrometricum TaxID=472368 RepID=A0A2Z7CGB8_9LAMI|nr:hypothetical protein F511_06539 [Dorcoceras hygrometricum]